MALTRKKAKGASLQGHRRLSLCLCFYANVGMRRRLKIWSVSVLAGVTFSCLFSISRLSCRWHFWDEEGRKKEKKGKCAGIEHYLFERACTETKPFQLVCMWHHNISYYYLCKGAFLTTSLFLHSPNMCCRINLQRVFFFSWKAFKYLFTHSISLNVVIFSPGGNTDAIHYPSC